MAMSTELETLTEDFADLAVEAATTEADYKHRFASRMVRLADSNQKMTAPIRHAMADLEASEELRARLIAEARRNACREGMLSLRHRIDAMRTLAANVRAQT